MFAFTRVPLARQFLLVSFAILLLGMLIIGSLVSYQIKDGVLNRTAALTALYVDSFISPELQVLSENETLPIENRIELDRLLSETNLGEQIVSFKVWSRNGAILYASNPTLVGRQFELDDDIISALSGSVVSSISNLDRPEHELERLAWDQLIETYAPIRKAGGSEVLAVSEFYQRPDDLVSEVNAARAQAWFVVGASTLTIYILLAGIVNRASNTILKQELEMEKQLTTLKALFEQNKRLHERVLRAGARTIILNELYLRRLSADIHDGPGQDLALALMKTEAINDAMPGDTDANVRGPWKKAVPAIHNALSSANVELRKIATGLRLPELEGFDLSEVVTRATRAFEEKTGQQLDLNIELDMQKVPAPVKITLYRLVQEALSNSYRHSGGARPSVKIWQEDECLKAEISDQGVGFVLDFAEKSGGLGLMTMRERVELLQGNFKIRTNPGEGTSVQIALPIDEIIHIMDSTM